MGLIITKSAGPMRVLAEVVQVISLLLTKFILPQEFPPMAMVAPETKPLPVMVMEVPPARVPLAGEIKLMLGDDRDGVGAI